MLSFREYNKKLTALKNMRRITRTMKLVSAVKFMRAQDVLRRATPYLEEGRALAEATRRVGRDLAEHPLFREPVQVQQVLLLLFSSDLGLCGGFNRNVVHAADGWLRERQGHVKILRMSFVGRQGHTVFKHRAEVRSVYAAMHPVGDMAVRIGSDLLSTFKERRYDEIYIAWNRFHTALSQKAVVERLLPLPAPAAAPKATAIGALRLLEPSGTRMWDRLGAALVNNRILEALTHNTAGEHGARMTAMDMATRNIDQLEESYTLQRNRARQSVITRELTEIVAGAESLK